MYLDVQRYITEIERSIPIVQAEDSHPQDRLAAAVTLRLNAERLESILECTD